MVPERVPENLVLLGKCTRNPQNEFGCAKIPNLKNRVQSDQKWVYRSTHPFCTHRAFLSPMSNTKSRTSAPCLFIHGPILAISPKSNNAEFSTSASETLSSRSANPPFMGALSMSLCNVTKTCAMADMLSGLRLAARSGWRMVAGG
jgi:hypothetical protein